MPNRIHLVAVPEHGAENLGMAVFARGGTARLESFRAWRMQPARFDLGPFQG